MKSLTANWLLGSGGDVAGQDVFGLKERKKETEKYN